MKKFVASIAALALTVPAVASAQTAAGALSVKSAAVQPVRASAKAGKTKALSTAAIVGLVAAAGGIIIAVSTGSSK